MKHLKDLLDLKELARKDKAIYKEYLTTKEWYERMETKFPKSLEPEANNVIENRHDLERSGIFGDLEYQIKEELKIDDEFEHYYYTTDTLTPLDIIRIKLLIRENPNNPYSVPLKEKIQYAENR